MIEQILHDGPDWLSIMKGVSSKLNKSNNYLVSYRLETAPE
jgi:hypothetical protein